MNPDPTRTPDDNGKSLGPIIKGLVMIAALAAIGAWLRTSDLGMALDESWVDAHIRGRGAVGWAIFAGATALFTGVGLPRQIVSFLGGYAFGALWGTALAAAGTLAGCMAAFGFARLLGRDFVMQRFARKIAKINAFLKENPFTMALVIRFMPLGSNLATNLAAGVSSIKPLPFFAGSLIGFLPQTLVFALLGSGIKVNPTWRIGLAVVLFLVSAWLGLALLRKYKPGKNSAP